MSVTISSEWQRVRMLAAAHQQYEGTRRSPKWFSRPADASPGTNTISQGSDTLADVETSAKKQTDQLGISLSTFQSNHEGQIVDRIQEARGHCDFVILNPGGLTHTSVTIRDALLGVQIPFIEVHVSNIHAREPWRNHSYFSDKAVAVICGLGVFGYTAAIDFIARKLDVQKGS
ncbi:uncharacterized protein LTR77_005531 [Saxophila tyrrhenica]|uniref:Catabolic 3-dehydroquinase n=1 Tax=Saxophila tyrrhenica TaxID=1690608 RepID=A0AAV9PCZ0_9PEZI|nr:hypothetical protein LTR77_005531 [Saxophila tyrrhenica]